MRIVINNIAASQGGALTILRDFYNFVLNDLEAQNHEWIFLLSDHYIKETENIKVKIIKEVKKSWLTRLKFDYFTGKKIVESLKADLVISFQNTIIRGINCPQFLYVHQPIPFQKEKEFSLIKKNERLYGIYQYFIGKLIKSSIKRSDLVIVQTEWMKQAVIEQTKISGDKIIEVFPSIKDYSKYKIDGKFKNNSFFYPAGNLIYKNHQCIFEAVKILNNQGIEDFEILLTIHNIYNIKSKNIKFVGTMKFEEVLRQYNESTLIFPSYIESLGLPLIEGREIGTIILAADTAFSREILRDYTNAYFFKYDKPNELARLMKDIIDGNIIKKEINNTSKTQQKHSWSILMDYFKTSSVFDL